MFSFSTCWNCHRHTDGEILVAELRLLGFTNLELGRGLKISLLPGIKRLLKRGRIRIASVSNVCPAPIEFIPDNVRDSCHLTSDSLADRQQAIRLTVQTFHYARELGAEFVVLQLGRTSVDGFTESLFSRVRRGEIHSSGFVKEKLAGLHRREKDSEKYLELAKASLDELLPHAEDLRIKIGIKCRGEYEDVPHEKELEELMQEYRKSPWIGYWHDFGEAQKKANLGLLDHRQYLARMRPYLFGCHVHDLRWPDQIHKLPLSGMVEFDKLIPLLPKDVPMVWELDSSCRKADIQQVFPVWEKQYGKLFSN